MTRHTANTFLKCSSLNEMVLILGVSQDFMKDFSNVSKSYNVYKIKKRKGGFREIEAPNKELKRVQSWLAEILKEVYRIQGHDCCYGFVGSIGMENKSIVENAKCHVGKKMVLNMDIQNFYPSIKKETISNMFKVKPFEFPDSVVRLLTEITCLDHLPTGAPTSPVLSNIVCWWLDEELNKLAAKHKLTYTRYVDDLTFSGEAIEKEEFSKSVSEILDRFEMKVNDKKTRLRYNTSRQMVTGITVNEKTNINRKYIRKVRAELHQLRSFPKQISAKRLEVLRGKINFIGDVKGREDGVYLKQLKEYEKILDIMVILK